MSTILERAPEREEVFDAECRSCGGTGLYVGMAERSGAAVVCHTCKGTARERIVLRFRPFTGRHSRPGVVRVYASNPGIVIGASIATRLEDFGGLAYADWQAGIPFVLGTEDRAHTCPAWFYQSADSTKRPEWDECMESLGRRFSECPHFPTKDACWRRFDAEQGAVQIERRRP
jgi:hypothetical protein